MYVQFILNFTRTASTMAPFFMSFAAMGNELADTAANSEVAQS